MKLKMKIVYSKKNINIIINRETKSVLNSYNYILRLMMIIRFLIILLINKYIFGNDKMKNEK